MTEAEAAIWLVRYWCSIGMSFEVVVKWLDIHTGFSLCWGISNSAQRGGRIFVPVSLGLRLVTVGVAEFGCGFDIVEWEYGQNIEC
jgi:hypothetical protein